MGSYFNKHHHHHHHHHYCYYYYYYYYFYSLSQHLTISSNRRPTPVYQSPMYPHYDQAVLQSSVFVSDGRMRLFCIMSSVGFKSDFLVAAARGVMLRTSPSQIRGRGTHWGTVWYPRKLGRKKRDRIKSDRKEKGKK
jgi:hypothetical protein